MKIHKLLGMWQIENKKESHGSHRKQTNKNKQINT